MIKCTVTALALLIGVNAYAQDAPTFKSDCVDFTKDVLHDQAAIWTSPFHMHDDDGWKWLAVGAATAGLLAADHPLLQALPHKGSVLTAGNRISDLGTYITVYPAALGLYAGGWITKNDDLRETGFLSGEALLDSDIVVVVLKEIARRERPYEGDRGGHFEKGGDSFPSGHSAQAWSLAAVLSARYGNTHTWVPYVAYTYATTISVARLLAQEHFASDVFVGGVIGYFIGHYVAEKGSRRFHHLVAWAPRIQVQQGARLDCTGGNLPAACGLVRVASAEPRIYSASWTF